VGHYGQEHSLLPDLSHLLAKLKDSGGHSMVMKHVGCCRFLVMRLVHSRLSLTSPDWGWPCRLCSVGPRQPWIERNPQNQNTCDPDRIILVSPANGIE
jgi:hypothetical protein